MGSNPLHKNMYICKPMKKLLIGIARLFGWKYDIPKPGTRPEIERCVIIMAPHTSSFDFYLGATCLWKLGVNFRVFIKQDYFKFPIVGWLLRRIGAIPVDRGNRHNGLVDQAVKAYSQLERFVIVITPEGTRKPTRHWKRGFYEIATKAHVPIILSYVDYDTKHMGIGPRFDPTGNWEQDLAQIKEFYRNIHARHPEKFVI